MGPKKIARSFCFELLKENSKQNLQKGTKWMKNISFKLKAQMQTRSK